MNIAYVFTATGKYNRFIDRLVETGNNHFFSSENVEYIAFTDDLSYKGKYKNLRIVEQRKMGWPYDTLMRFHLLESIIHLLDHDYIFYGNANLIFNTRIAKDVLPDESGLVATIHPGQNQLPKSQRSYERNQNSKAYVPFGNEGPNYYQGCFFGGENKKFLDLVKILKNNIQEDSDNGIIALWHDESHLNRYFIDNQPKELNSGYAYPESANIPFEKKIIQLNKDIYGGHNFLRQ
jgi:hypothetical protein